MNTYPVDLEPNTPDIITSGVVEVISFYDGMDPNQVIPNLIEGEYVLIEEYYYNGLEVLRELKDVLRENFPGDTFLNERQFRSAYRKASHSLLLMVVDHQLDVDKSPQIGWFELFYPNEFEFLISFPNVQGLNSSWQWYLNGLTIEILGLKIHPYYGVYFPTRFDHLELFDNWLQEYVGKKEVAIDIGVGSGVLSFLLLQNGFSDVIGTDINKNAIIGTSLDRGRMGFDNRLRLRHGDLFADCDTPAELIVFNPPWLQIVLESDAELDKAIYYEPDLFNRFFEEAKKHLQSDGTLVLFFSNLGQVVDVNTKHPIHHELSRFNRFSKVEYREQSVEQASTRTRRKNWRKDEKVELWVLKHK